MDIENDLSSLEWFNNMAFDIRLNQPWATSERGYQNE